MTLYWFLLVVSSLAFGSMPAESIPVGRCLGASLVLVAGWSLLIWTASATVRRAVDRGFDEHDAAKLLERQLDLFRWLGIIVGVVCLGGFGLASAVQTWPMFASSMALQSIVLLAPALTITAAVWYAENRYGTALGYTHSTGMRVVREWLSAMLTTGGWILFPVLLMLIATDLIRGSTLLDEKSSAGILALLAVVGSPLLMPLVLRRVWKTAPIDHSRWPWIEPLLRSVQIKRLPVRQWDTGMQVNNAVVAGFLPGLRSMIVSDRLLSEMPRRELSMVLLHELAHVQRCHVWLRVLAMGPSWIVAVAMTSYFAGSPTVTVLSNLLAAISTFLTLRFIAHATEYDADRVACLMSLNMPTELDPPQSTQAAADRYVNALRWVTRQDRSPEKASWLHPSVANRCSKLQLWAEETQASSPEVSNQNMNCA